LRSLWVPAVWEQLEGTKLGPSTLCSRMLVSRDPEEFTELL
jgi:hypothetical protein